MIYTCKIYFQQPATAALMECANKERLPDLARVYCVSTPSERLFSVAGEVISDHRSALLPDNGCVLFQI